MEKLLYINSSTIRGLLKKANQLFIAQSQIVDIVKEGDEFVMIYYGESEE